ncbi:MAG: prolipoprotein diacylglyceryl transferase, partial [bacterium]
NGELYGKPTDGSWGVIFPGDPQRLPRHPSQLYEAFLEGIVLFAILYALRRAVPNRPGLQSSVFLIGYALARISVEFVRLPDRDIGYSWGWVTRGQMLSLPMAVAGLIWLYFVFRAPPAKEPRELEKSEEKQEPPRTQVPQAPEERKKPPKRRKTRKRK